MDLDLKEGFWKMRTLRDTTIAAATVALFALSGGALMGCTAEAKASGSLESGSAPNNPPPPPAGPTDDDGDGINNADDKCPNEKEDGKPPDDKDGCPNQDPDGDGISGAADKCPDQPETKNDFEDDDGCPDKKPLVQLIGSEVKINQKIQFKKGSAGIEEESKPIIDSIAEILKTNEDIQLVEIGGHASKEGDAASNKTLSQKRVDAVAKELTTRGIAKERMFPQGYGIYCPLDPGDTPEALEKNRRVEIKVLFRKGQPTDMKRGCEAAEKAGIKPKALPTKPWEAKPGAKPAEPAKPATGATPTPASKTMTKPPATTK
jgi:outer membrane protein OmpA-like peptidoglycan-associated protein